MANGISQSAKELIDVINNFGGLGVGGVSPVQSSEQFLSQALINSNPGFQWDRSMRERAARSTAEQALKMAQEQQAITNDLNQQKQNESARYHNIMGDYYAGQTRRSDWEMREGAQIKNAEKLAKAAAMRKEDEYPILQAILAQAQEDIPGATNLLFEMRDKLDPETFAVLAKSMGAGPEGFGGVGPRQRMVNPAVLNALLNAHPRSKNVTTMEKTRTEVGGRDVNNKRDNETRLEMVRLRNEALKNITAAKNSGKDLRYLAQGYQQKAEELRMAGNEELADMYFAMAGRAANLQALGSPAAGKTEPVVPGLDTKPVVPQGSNAPKPNVDTQQKRDELRKTLGK
jgi:hypothetical protein